VAAQLASILRLSAVGGACGCGVGEQGQAGVGGKLHGLEIEVEGADDRMMDAFVARPVEADVVGGPLAADCSLRVDSSPISSMSCLS
jgi:hypothetical protein